MTVSKPIGARLDTRQSRRVIGFPTKPEWIRAEARFTDHALRIAGHPVMEDWEDGYMRRLASVAATNGGHVLELGYGMGISARAVLDNPSVEHHCIVECHPDVMVKALDDLRDAIAAQRVHMLSGFWEDLLPLVKDASFDGILFDTYPLTEDELHSNHFCFFRQAFRLLKPGGLFTYYSDEDAGFSDTHLAKLHEAGFHDVDFESCYVAPPADCEYWHSETIIVPRITKS